MLYHLLAPLARDYLVFNLFNYISFRAAGAMLTALLLAFVVGPKKRGKCGESGDSEDGFGVHDGNLSVIWSSDADAVFAVAGFNINLDLTVGSGL